MTPDPQHDPSPLAPPAAKILPDGRYRAVIRKKDVAWEDGEPQPYLVRMRPNGEVIAWTGVEAEIVDLGSEFGGARITDPFVSTLEHPNGGIPMVWILVGCLGVDLPESMSIKQLVDKFVAVLADGPEVEIEVKRMARRAGSPIEPQIIRYFKASSEPIACMEA